MMNEMLSQDEINALLNGGAFDVPSSDDSQDTIVEDLFDDIEKDALGEIGNISMGSAATNLFALLGQKVEITTPVVSQTTINEIAKNHQIPFVSVYIKYSVGIDGMNLLILKEDDVKVMTSLMMGGDGISDLPDELTELHLSAISEAMNQMMGATATSLSEMIGGKIDITPPKVSRVTIQGDRLDPDILDLNEVIVCTSFRMKVGDLINSEIMQILPIEFAKQLLSKMMGISDDSTQEAQQEQIQSPVEPVVQTQAVQETASQVAPPQQPIPQVDNMYSGANMMPPPMPYPQQQYAYTEQAVQNPVRVQPAQFSSFDPVGARAFQVPENIDIIKDVMLQITVELGKTVKPIDEILEFKPGSVLELDKVVGESLDILANGKKIAMGEVVVIDENYGIRITDIVKPDKRLQSL